MPDTCSYGFGCDIELNFEAVIDKTQSLLQKKSVQVYTQHNGQQQRGAP